MKLSKIISPEQFRDLADYLDRVDSSSGDEVQVDLRRFADNLEMNEKWLDTFIENFGDTQNNDLASTYVEVLKTSPLLNDQTFSSTDPKTKSP